MSSERTVHRALLESSVLLVTLLFVIAGIMPESRSFVISLAFVSIPFVLTMMFSFFLMLELAGVEGFSMGARQKRLTLGVEIYSFILGLILLLIMFVEWNLGVSGGLVSIVFVGLLTAGGATVFMLLQSRAERKRMEARYA